MVGPSRQDFSFYIPEFGQIILHKDRLSTCKNLWLSLGLSCLYLTVPGGGTCRPKLFNVSRLGRQVGQARHSACALEEDLSCADTTADTLVVIQVGNYTLYRITTSH